MKRLLIIGLCVLLLPIFAGCDGNTPEQPAGGTTTVATTATTTTTAGEITTTTGETMVATTTTTTTMTTKVPTTTTTQAPTTTKPTTTTEAPTTTTKPPVTDTALQIGGPTFTLDGVTFELGVSPEKLLAHLGEPKEKKSMGDSQISAMATQYYYDDLLFETITPDVTGKEVLVAVYFISNRYSFDGLTVGDTAERLNNIVTSRLEVFTQGYVASGMIGGPCYTYDADRKDGTEKEHDLVLWSVFFVEDGKYNPYIDLPSNETPIECIKIKFLYTMYDFVNNRIYEW